MMKIVFLYEYLYDEQYEMISSCTELYKKVLGENPIYFRAGKYGANREKLDILNELGYKYDFSEFFGQKWCGINPSLTADIPCKYKRIIEIPVTAFYSIDLFGKRRVDKIDLEMSEMGYKHILKIIEKKNNYLFTNFLHGVSFIMWKESPNVALFDKKKYKAIKRKIEYTIGKDNIEFVSPDMLDDIMGVELNCIGNKQCSISFKNPFMSYIFIFFTSYRIRKQNKKARFF